MSDSMNEVEGYAASLRLLAQWIDEAVNGTVPVYARVDLGDLDTDELRAAADFIERQGCSHPAPTTPVPVAQRKGWPKKGDKMRFLGRNGHDYQLEAAKKVFNTEDIYEVAQFDLGDWSSCILFVGFEGRWNSVMFDWCDAEQVDITPASSTATSAWLPIETAPKDGTEVIGLYHRPGEDGFKTVTYGPWTVAFERGQWRSSWDGQEVIAYMSDFGTEYKEPDVYPTHWQPMPSASSEPRKERGAP